MTVERVALLRKLWSEGQSASQIAKELGGVTRNAVIGKVHRLGLSNRVDNSSTTRAKKVETQPKTARSNDKEPGKPYCKPCVEIAYQPMSSRRDRRR